LIFSALLSISPLLIIYSRTARPYSLTLFLSMIALAAFHRLVVAERMPWRSGLGYLICSVLSVWLHLITLPLVVAPFIVVGLPALFAGNWSRIGRISLLALFTATGLFALLLPALIGHPEALGSKLGIQSPEWGTVYGALHTWLGTSSSLLMLAGLALSAIGAGRLWHRLPIMPSLITGLGLTVAVILLTRPAWVNIPLTLARYLLPVAPLLLLAISLGISQLSEMLTSKWGDRGKWAGRAALGFGLLVTAHYSPLHSILANPNSNSTHAVFQVDFRADHNPVFQYQKNFPLSRFWRQLASFPPDSLKIVTSPFYFESFNWDAPRWERISRQRVMPGYLTGFCLKHRWGEVPDGDGFRFQNVGYPGNPQDLQGRRVDLLVFQKPLKMMIEGVELELGIETRDCEKAHRELYSEPVYEDEYLLVFPLSEKVRNKFNAER
jgi:hypothetical protein